MNMFDFLEATTDEINKEIAARVRTVSWFYYLGKINFDVDKGLSGAWKTV